MPTISMAPIVRTDEWASLPDYDLPNPAGRINVTDELTESPAFEILLMTGIDRIHRMSAVLDSYWGTPTFGIYVMDRHGQRYHFSCYKHAYRWSAWGPSDSKDNIDAGEAFFEHTSETPDGTRVLADSAEHLIAAQSFLEAWEVLVAFETSPAGRERHAQSWYEKWDWARRGDEAYAHELEERLRELASEVKTRSPFRRWVNAYLRERARHPAKS